MNAAFDPAFGEAWNSRQVSDALAMPNTHAIVMDSDGNEIKGPPLDSVPCETAGFVLTRHGADEEELLLIAVTPSCRGRGLGQALIKKLFQQANARGVARIFLEMRRGNPAIHLYRRSGFEPIGERINYYRLASGGKADAITFARKI